MAVTKKIILEVDSKDAQKGLDKTSDALKKVGKSGGLVGKSFKTIGVAMKAMGWGLLIGLLAGIFEAFKKNQKMTDLVARGMDTLQKVVGFLVDGFVEALKLIDLLSFGMLNLSGEADGASSSLQSQRNELELIEAEQQKITLQYQTQAEKLRQVRDDESLTMEERMNANNQLGGLLEEQFQKERANVLYMIEVRQKELALDEHSIEKKKALIAAETMLAELEERITGQRSEQLVNVNSLKREQVSISRSNASSVKEEVKTLEEMISAMEAYKGTLELTAEQEYNKERKNLEEEYQKFLEEVRGRNTQKVTTEAGKELRRVRRKYKKNQEALKIHYDMLEITGNSMHTKSEVNQMVRDKKTLANKIAHLKELRKTQEAELQTASDEEVALTEKYDEIFLDMELDFAAEKEKINKAAIDKAMGDLMSDAQKEIMLTKGKDAQLLSMLVDLKGREEKELADLKAEKVLALENDLLDNEAKLAIEERFLRDKQELEGRYREEGAIIEEEYELEKEEKRKARNAAMVDSAMSIANSLVAISAATAKKEISELDKKFKKGEISEEEYNKQKNAIQKKQAKKEKAAALLGIAVDTARGISQAVAAGAGIPFPGNIPAILTGVAAVLAGVAQASTILGETPDTEEPSIEDDTGDSDAPTVPTFGAIETDAPPVQAFVVEGDVSSAQALANDIALQATL